MSVCSRWGTAFLVANIMNDVQANQPYTDPTQAGSLTKAQQAFATAEANEETRSWNYLNQQAVICADETEAKSAVGSSHKVAMPKSNLKMIVYSFPEFWVAWLEEGLPVAEREFRSYNLEKLLSIKRENEK